MRALTKNSRGELLSMVERLRAREADLIEERDALETALSAARGAEAKMRGMYAEVARVSVWTVLGYVVGVCALAWCCYLVGSGVLVWPWEVGQ